MNILCKWVYLPACDPDNDTGHNLYLDPDHFALSKRGINLFNRQPGWLGGEHEVILRRTS